MTTLKVSRIVVLALMCLSAWACERPPMQTTQLGYRGLGMQQVDNPRLITAANRALNAVPPPLPLLPAEGQRAGELYTNVQIPALQNLSVAQFSVLMTALTTWVAPTQGCVYCHVGENYASDDIYSKVASRRMLQMTMAINRDWNEHVGATGVTCYTCHRGRPVLEEVWLEVPEQRGAGGFTAQTRGQNSPAALAGLASVPGDPLTPFLRGGEDIRAQGNTALPVTPGKSIQETEATYSLMMHMSDALGVNCTYCHNSRSFAPWESSTPARVTAYHGLRMTRDINNTYVEPLRTVLPAERLGPLGDAPKASCTTCHRGLSRPLNGVSMLDSHPVLRGN
jgi:photosynthetic reaction center cytochrome c subunit